MAKYEKNPDDPGKYQCPICEYGRGPGGGRSRAAVSRHYNATHLEEGDSKPSKPSKTSITSISTQAEKPPKGQTVAADEKTATEGPTWLNFDMSEGDGTPATSSINTAARATIQGLLRNPESIKSEKELEEFHTQQARMMKWLFKGGVDPALEWWARAVTSDEKFTIERSGSDWELFEDVAKSWLEFRGIVLPITPDVVMLGTLGAFYAPVVVKVNKNRDPSRPGLLKRLRKRVAMRRMLKQKEADSSN